MKVSLSAASNFGQPTLLKARQRWPFTAQCAPTTGLNRTTRIPQPYSVLTSTCSAARVKWGGVAKSLCWCSRRLKFSLTDSPKLVISNGVSIHRLQSPCISTSAKSAGDCAKRPLSAYREDQAKMLWSNELFIISSWRRLYAFCEPSPYKMGILTLKMPASAVGDIFFP